MREYLELLKENGLLKVIEDELDIDLEIPHIAYIEVKKRDSKAILFKNPVSKRLNKKFDTPVLMNLFGSFKATELFLGKRADDIAEEIEDLLHLKPPSSFQDKLSLFAKLFHLKNVFPK
ncbi:MAG: menaquinone biosynthesis decarboxylase, partial [Epsilonproteobacteria bacterium]|nr:menaquinone biosynthesis decarboxylase [Campylobacterota bacterium]